MKLITAKHLAMLLFYPSSTIAFAWLALSLPWNFSMAMVLLSIAALCSLVYLRIFVYFYLQAREERRILARHPQLESRLERQWQKYPEPDTPSLTETRHIMNWTQAITLSSGLVCAFTVVGLLWRMI